MAETSRMGRWLIQSTDSVDSTQKWVRQRLSVLPDRSVILASAQTSGRGRTGRVWQSPPGGFYASLLLKPSPPHSYAACVSLLAAFVLAEIMEEHGLPALVKWPNDVLVRGRKLAGIIAESGGHPDSWFILGIGVNLECVPDVPGRQILPAGAWGQFCNPPLPGELLDAFLSKTDTYWPCRESDPLDQVREKLHCRLWNMGAEVIADNGGQQVRGIISGVDRNGFLLLTTDSGERSFASGELLTVHGGSVEK